MSTGPLILGIETSCDETGVGIVRGSELLADEVAFSDIELKPAQWWRDRGVTLRYGMRASAIDPRTHPSTLRYRWPPNRPWMTIPRLSNHSAATRTSSS